MPTIELRGNGEDKIWLLAVMLFPDDPDLQQQYYARNFVAEILATGEEITDHITPELLRVLLDSPGRDEMAQRAKAATRKGVVAGDYLGMMFVMSLFPTEFGEPSNRKAEHLMARWTAKASYGDGEAMPTSRNTIRAYYSQYKDVAHLWAAYRLHHAFPIRPQNEALSSVESRDDLLAIAASIQDWGCSFVPKRARPADPLLDRSTLWGISTTRRLLPPLKAAPNFLVAGMRNYKARSVKPAV
ncbi:MAG: hypothetical protein QM696_08685 [Steroidobacteraceae bacterium]